MRSKQYLDTRHRSEPLVTFPGLEGRDIGTTVPGKEAPAKIHGVLTVKQKPVERVARCEDHVI